MEIPQGNTMENSGKQNPKIGFKSPPEHRRKFSRPRLVRGAVTGKVTADDVTTIDALDLLGSRVFGNFG
jgi:hypothetical protein